MSSTWKSQLFSLARSLVLCPLKNANWTGYYTLFYRPTGYGYGEMVRKTNQFKMASTVYENHLCEWITNIAVSVQEKSHSSVIFHTRRPHSCLPSKMCGNKVLLMGNDFLLISDLVDKLEINIAVYGDCVDRSGMALASLAPVQYGKYCVWLLLGTRPACIHPVRKLPVSRLRGRW